MSGQYVRLPDSKRNELISKFNKGIIDPDYEVIPSRILKADTQLEREKSNCLYLTKLLKNLQKNKHKSQIIKSN